MKYDFTNKAIKCDTWEQMLSLVNIVHEQGASVAGMCEDAFDRMPYFTYNRNCSFYSHYSVAATIGDTIIHYSDFISNNNTKK